MTGTNRREVALKPLTLLHTSDLHLGSDDRPEQALQGFDAILDIARRSSVDALLIAGDLFDGGRVPEELVAYALAALAGLGCPVVVLPGNHDTPLTSPSDASNEPLSRVHVLKDPAGQSITFDSLGLSVWGRPVYNHAPGFHPLAGLEPRSHNGWYVAIAHGIVTDEHTFPERGSPITTEELAQADCDYIALGHAHVFRDVTRGLVPAFYSGSPSEGQASTAALVTLDPANGVSVQVIHVSPSPAPHGGPGRGPASSPTAAY